MSLEWGLRDCSGVREEDGRKPRRESGPHGRGLPTTFPCCGQWANREGLCPPRAPLPSPCPSPAGCPVPGRLAQLSWWGRQCLSLGPGGLGEKGDV